MDGFSTNPVEVILQICITDLPRCPQNRHNTLADIFYNQLPDPIYYPILLASALPLYVLGMVKISHRLQSLGSTFIYIILYIQLDFHRLQSSCSVNSTIQCIRQAINHRQGPPIAIDQLVRIS